MNAIKKIIYKSIAPLAKLLGRIKWPWRFFYFAMRKIKSQLMREWFWRVLTCSGVVSRMCDEGYWKILTLLRSGEEYGLPGKGGGINSVLRWQQMYWRSPIKARYTDKIAVREFIREKIGGEYLIPMLPAETTCWTNPDDIDFELLPSRFVLKLNNGSGMNLIVNNKSSLDLLTARETLRKWMNSDYAAISREYHYKEISNRIYCEAFIETANGEPPPDYKFMCSNGNVLFAWVDTDRFKDHHRDVYDVECKRLEVSIHYPPTGKAIDKPAGWDDMIEIASRLSQGIPIVRVDLYNVDGKIYFGEMTFTSDSCSARYTPFSFSLEMAAKVDLRPFVVDK